MIAQLLNNKINRLFLILGGFFISNALVAEFVGVKIFSLERTLGFDAFNWSIFGIDGLGFNLTAGVVLWPIVFVMTDVINEYFGKRGVRVLSYAAIAFIIYAFAMVYLAIQLVPNDWWQYESGTLMSDNSLHIKDMDLAFTRIFGQGLWIIIGSLVAFLIGQVVDVIAFHRIKQWTGDQKIWLRATGSTLISQFVDSFVVLIIAFYIGADWELERVLAIGCVNYIYKFVVAIGLTPLIYAAHYMIDQYLGIEIARELRNEASLN